MEETKKGKGKVLVVDDDRYLREALDRLLRMADWQVCTATDGKEALELVQSKPDAFDKMVIDIVLPELSGVDLAEKIALAKPDTRFVFISGFSDAVDAIPNVDRSRTAFLAKPFTGTKLLETLESL